LPISKNDPTYTEQINRAKPELTRKREALFASVLRGKEILDDQIAKLASRKTEIDPL